MLIMPKKKSKLITPKKELKSANKTLWLLLPFVIYWISQFTLEEMKVSSSNIWLNGCVDVL